MDMGMIAFSPIEFFYFLGGNIEFDITASANI